MEYSILKSFVEQKMSIRDIGKKTNKSATSIRYWLNKYKLKTANKSFSDGYIGENHILRVDGKPIQNCSKCGIFLNEETGYWRESKKVWQANCKKCHNNYNADRWKNSKKKAVEYKGGKCEKCGYNKCIDALEFHHIDPDQKDKNFGNLKLRKWEDQKKELDKCVCVCANCHREIHAELRLDIISELV
jgi:hypothetical protein